MTDFVYTINDCLDESLCNSLITKFEMSGLEHHYRVDNQGKPRFTQMDIMPLYQRDAVITDAVDNIIDAIRYTILPMYGKYTNTQFFPAEWDLERFRIKKYKAKTDDEFGPHVDVADYASAKRFLAIFFYLNDVMEGGETQFFNEGKWIKPRKGTAVVFPPFWMFPHQGRPAFSNDKYLLSTYLHYK